MTDNVVAVRDVEADARWRNWCARGAESDRRTAVRMGTLTVLIAISLLTWLLVGLL